MTTFKDWQDAKDYMIKFNKDNNVRSKSSDGPVCTMIVVFTEDSFNKPYTELERSYRFTNKEKIFIPSNGGYSLFASSLDGTDPCVRLESYMEDEGVNNGWVIEKIYIESE